VLTFEPTAPSPNESPEIVLNLWYFIDDNTKVAYRLAGRAYAMFGTDQEKLSALKKLSASDFMISETFKIPESFKVVYGNETLLGAIHARNMYEYGVGVFQHVIDALEKSIPRQVRSLGGELQGFQLQIPQDPLIVMTCVIEREDGRLEARVGIDAK
jgi:hypothetical protein